jgi:hypothetical protein
MLHKLGQHTPMACLIPSITRAWSQLLCGTIGFVDFSPSRRRRCQRDVAAAVQHPKSSATPRLSADADLALNSRWSWCSLARLRASPESPTLAGVRVAALARVLMSLINPRLVRAAYLALQRHRLQVGEEFRLETRQPRVDMLSQLA